MGTDSVLLVQRVWPHLNCMFLYFSSLVSRGQPWEMAGQDKEKKREWTATESRFCEFLHSQTLKPWNELTYWSFGFLLRSGPDRDKNWAEVLTSESMTNIKEESSLQNFVVFLIAFNLTVGCIGWLHEYVWRSEDEFWESILLPFMLWESSLGFQVW